MKIRVISPKDNVKICIPLPNTLIMNRLACSLLTRCSNKYTKGYMIDSNQMYKLMQCLKDSKKVFGHYKLVDIETSEGEIIQIEI